MAFYDEEMRIDNQNHEVHGAESQRKAAPYILPTNDLLTQVMYANAMQEKARYFQPEITGKVELIPNIMKKNREWYAEFRVGVTHKYIVKSIEDLIRAVETHAWVEYEKKLAFYHERNAFTEKSREILDFLAEYVPENRNAMKNFYEHYRYSSYYYSSSDSQIKREIFLAGSWMVKFSRIFAGDSCELDASSLKDRMIFLEERPKLKITVEETEAGGYRMKVPAAEVFSGAGDCCVRVGSIMYLCGPEFLEDLGASARLFNGSRNEYRIHPKDGEVFCSSVSPFPGKMLFLHGDGKAGKLPPQASSNRVLSGQDFWKGDGENHVLLRRKPLQYAGGNHSQRHAPGHRKGKGGGKDSAVSALAG